MNPSARVGSIDALQTLHDALAEFGPEAQEALGAAANEIRRVLDWLCDQLTFWRRSVEKRQEDVNRARADLAHKRAMTRGQNHACSEQELALRKAQALLREAEEKVQTTRRWLLHLPQEVNDYQGPARRLSGLLDADLKVGLTMLQNKIASLRAYTALTSPAELPAALRQASPAAPAAPTDKGQS
jgi:hypothetical protein